MTQPDKKKSEMKLSKRREKRRKKDRRKLLLKDLEEKFKEENMEEGSRGMEATLELEESSRFDKILRLATVFIFLGLIGFGGFIFYLSSRSSPGVYTISLENVELPQTGSVAGEAIEYYSPSQDLIINYDADKFDAYDNEGGIYILPKGVLNTFALLEIVDEEEVEDPKNYFVAKYSDLYTDLAITAEWEEEDFSYTQFKYNEEFNFKGESVHSVYHTLVIGTDSGNLICLDITERGGKEKTEKLMPDLLQVLHSVDLEPVDLSSQAEVELVDGEVSLSYDRAKWVVRNQSTNSLELTFRNQEFESSNELMNTQTSFEIYTQSGEEVDDSYISDLVENELSMVQENYIDFELEVIIDNGEREIDEKEFSYIQYKYVWLESPVIVTKYYGYDLQTQVLIRITTYEGNIESEGTQNLTSLFESIEINTVEVTEEGEGTAQIPEEYVLGSNIGEIQKSTVIGKPAVVYLFNKSCVKLTIEEDPDLVYSSGKDYSLCSLGFGSGFFVNKNGYIVSNAHVVSPNPLDVAIEGMLYGEDENNLYKYLSYDAIALAEELYPEYQVRENLSDPKVVDLIEGMMASMIVIGEEEEIVELSETSYENFVQGDERFVLDENTYELVNVEEYLEGELVANREVDSIYAIEAHKLQQEEDGITTPDLAIIKVEDPSSNFEYPAIRLLSVEKVIVGLSISVIGFPSSADDEDIFSSKASLIPTVTSGTISAIKQNYDNTFDLIQIDASISHGNSGGPIINSEGKVAGVATYMLSTGESADFNAGVSVSEIIKLLEESNVSSDVGRLTPLLEDGLGYFSNEYFKWAVSNFEEAKTLNSSIADEVDPIIVSAQESINSGEDNTPVITIGGIYIHKNELIIGAAIGGIFVCGVGLLIILFVLKLFFGRLKRSELPPELLVPNRGRQVEKEELPKLEKSQNFPKASSAPVVRPLVQVEKELSKKSIAEQPVIQSETQTKQVEPPPTQQTISDIQNQRYKKEVKKEEKSERKETKEKPAVHKPPIEELQAELNADAVGVKSIPLKRQKEETKGESAKDQVAETQKQVAEEKSQATSPSQIPSNSQVSKPAGEGDSSNTRVDTKPIVGLAGQSPSQENPPNQPESQTNESKSSPRDTNPNVGA